MSGISKGHAEILRREGRLDEGSKSPYQKPDIAIGIDPGYRTGLAIVNRTTRRLMVWETLKEPDDIFDHDIEEAVKESGAQTVYIQVPVKLGGKLAWFPGKGKASPAALVKNAMLAGWFAGFFEAQGYKVIPVPPRRGTGLKRSPALWRADWKWEGRLPSEHVRDAAEIAMTKEE